MLSSKMTILYVYPFSHHIEHPVTHAPLGFHWVSSKPMGIVKEQISSKYSSASTANPFLRSNITYKMTECTYKCILYILWRYMKIMLLFSVWFPHDHVLQWECKVVPLVSQSKSFWDNVYCIQFKESDNLTQLLQQQWSYIWFYSVWLTCAQEQKVSCIPVYASTSTFSLFSILFSV